MFQENSKFCNNNIEVVYRARCSWLEWLIELLGVKISYKFIIGILLPTTLLFIYIFCLILSLNYSSVIHFDLMNEFIILLTHCRNLQVCTKRTF